MVYVTGIILAFFLSLLLFSKKGKTAADKILAIWLMVIGAHLLLYYLGYTKFSFEHPHLLGIEMPLPLVHGPFLYLYTATLTDQLNYKKVLAFLHFVPAFFCWLYLANFFMLQGPEKVFIYEQKGVGYEFFNKAKFACIILSGIVYVCWSALLLRKHKRTILDQFSYTERINLRWLQYLTIGISAIWLFIFINDQVVFWGVVLFVLFIGYFGIKQVGIFTHAPVNNSGPGTPAPLNIEPKTAQLVNEPVAITTAANDEPEEENLSRPEQHTTFIQLVSEPRKKYAKSGLSDEMAVTVHSELSRLMDKEKVYCESELSLAVLAERLQILPNYLSQVINEIEGKNFYDYINSLRIQEFIRLTSMPDNNKYTILSLAFECGFNSKSSFNKNFKKATGQSPSEYLNSLDKAA